MSNRIANADYFQWYNRNERLRMHYPSELAIGFLVNNLEKPGRVLDLGCGSGRHTILAAELGHEAYGVDFDDGGFAECRRVAADRGLTVHLERGGMDNTGYPSGYFDALVCYSAVSANPLPQQREIVREIERVLGPGGVLLINFYGERDGTAQRCVQSGAEVAERTYRVPGRVLHSQMACDIPEYTFHVSTPEEVSDLLGGFQVLRQFEIYLPYGNGSLREDARPSHLLYGLTKKMHGCEDDGR